MKNDSLTVLKLFTRKLANCRYKVAPDVLVKHMENGRFGYTYDEKTNTVVTNDFVFADDVTALVSHIRSIFKEPHIFLKREDIVQNVTVASKVDSTSLRKTYKDDKIWRVRNGAVEPEYVHAYVYEDNLAIYENRFVTYLIDMLIEMVTRKINELLSNLETLNKKMGSETNECFAPQDYVNYAEENGGIPVLLKSNSVVANVVGSLIKSKKLLMAMQSRDLYIACKKAGPFNPNNLKATNIFLNDKDYFFCYNFYLNYLNKEPIFTTESKMYFGFVVVNLISAIVKSGFTIDEDAEDINISNSAHLKFDGIKFHNDVFTIELNQSGDNGILVTVTNLVDISKANYLFKVVNTTLIKTIDGFTSVGAYSKKLNLEKEEGIVRTILVNDIQEVDHVNTLYIVPNQTDVLDLMIKVVKTITLLVEGSEFLHTRYCPVCGSKLIAPDNDDYTCVCCTSLYHIFKYDARDLIWFKDLPKVATENRAKSAEKVEVPEITEAPAEEEKVVEPAIETKICSNCHYAMPVVDHFCPNCGKEVDILGNVIERQETVNTVVVEKIIEQPANEVKEEPVVEEAVPVEEVVIEPAPVEEAPAEPVVEEVKEEPAPVEETTEVVEEPAPAVEEVTAVEVPAEVPAEAPAPEKNMGLKKSFLGKLAQSENENQVIYAELKNYLMSFKRVYSRVSWNYDSFNLGRDPMAKIAIRGKTLVLFCALNPKEYENTKYYPHDMGNLKKFEDTPMMVKVKSERSVKYAKELIDIMLNGAEVKKDAEVVDYSMPYMTDDELVEAGYAKVVESNI